MATTEQLLQALQAVIDPNTGKDFVSTKTLKNLQVEGGDVSFDVELGYPAKSQIPGIRVDNGLQGLEELFWGGHEGKLQVGAGQCSHNS